MPVIIIWKVKLLDKKKRKRWKDLLKQVNEVSLTAIEKYILNQKFKMFG